MIDENVFDNLGTTTSSEEVTDWWCSICKKKGHTKRHHKMFPDIYGEVKK